MVEEVEDVNTRSLSKQERALPEKRKIIFKFSLTCIRHAHSTFRRLHTGAHFATISGDGTVCSVPSVPTSCVHSVGAYLFIMSLSQWVWPFRRGGGTNSLHCFAARELKGICHTHTLAGNLSHTRTCLQALSVTHTQADKSKFLTSHTNEASHAGKELQLQQAGTMLRKPTIVEGRRRGREGGEGKGMHVG